MTAYELGCLAALHHNTPGHLKQAYAQGFAGAFEKTAADWPAPAVGAGVGAASGALLNWLTTPEGMHWTRRILPGLIAGGGLGTAAGVYTRQAGRRISDNTSARYENAAQIEELKDSVTRNKYDLNYARSDSLFRDKQLYNTMTEKDIDIINLLDGLARSVTPSETTDERLSAATNWKDVLRTHNNQPYRRVGDVFDRRHPDWLE